MITDLILNVLCAIPLALLSLLPSVDISIPEGVFDWIFDISNAIGYLLPIKSLIPLLAITFSLTAFKIAWALILRVKSFIPTMGS